MFREWMAAAAVSVVLASCGPTADREDYIFDASDSFEFRLAEVTCRGEVAHSGAWRRTQRQAIFDACMQSKDFHSDRMLQAWRTDRADEQALEERLTKRGAKRAGLSVTEYQRQKKAFDRTTARAHFEERKRVDGLSEEQRLQEALDRVNAARARVEARVAAEAEE